MDDTIRLNITFGTSKLGADIAKDVTLLDALKEIVRGLEQIEIGDCEIIEDIDSEITTKQG